MGLLAAVAAAAVLSTAWTSGASASREHVPALAARAPSPGTQLWVAHYHGAGGGGFANSVAVSPGGGTVFVTGASNAAGGQTYGTVAYNAATGARLWVARYHGPGKNATTSVNVALSVAVSPTGGTVFVTGTSTGATGFQDYATVAYNAATGAQLWAARYVGPGESSSTGANSVAVSPSGGMVFVTGTSSGDYATVAYDAATGAQVWAQRYHGAGPGEDGARSVVVSPDGGTVFVTGASDGASGYDYATFAYDAATGTELWVQRYPGKSSPADGNEALSLAVSPDGGTVFVTGSSYRPASRWDYATIAYSAATGAQVWVKRYNGPGNNTDQAHSVTVSPDGRTVFVTGTSYTGVRTQFDYATVAYDAVTGAQLWVARYNGPGNFDDAPSSVATSPDGGTVYVTGFSYGRNQADDYATLAYSAATGAQLWVRRYHGPGNARNNAQSVAVSPSGTVFVTGGSSMTSTSPWQYYATVAYSG
jgi:outer membrane protein assembly factor BamB